MKMAHQMAGWKSKLDNFSTRKSELWRNAGQNAFQFQESCVEKWQNMM